MPNVYVVQEQMVKDRDTGSLRPAFDLTPAAQYGDLHFLLPAGQISLSTAPMLSQLKRALRGFTSDDFLVATGDPVAIMAAGAVAASMNGGVINVLKWDKRSQTYIKLTLSL